MKSQFYNHCVGHLEELGDFARMSRTMSQHILALCRNTVAPRHTNAGASLGVLQCMAVFYSVVQSGAVSCSVLQYGAV